MQPSTLLWAPGQALTSQQLPLQKALRVAQESRPTAASSVPCGSTRLLWEYTLWLPRCADVAGQGKHPYKKDLPAGQVSHLMSATSGCPCVKASPLRGHRPHPR